MMMLSSCKKYLLALSSFSRKVSRTALIATVWVSRVYNWYTIMLVQKRQALETFGVSSMEILSSNVKHASSEVEILAKGPWKV